MGILHHNFCSYVDRLCLHRTLDCLVRMSGVPNSGKSEWLDALAVNLAECYDWPIAFCSFEKSVEHHAMQLIEKFLRRPLLTVGWALVAVAGAKKTNTP